MSVKETKDASLASTLASANSVANPNWPGVDPLWNGNLPPELSPALLDVPAFLNEEQRSAWLRHSDRQGRRYAHVDQGNLLGLAAAGRGEFPPIGDYRRRYGEDQGQGGGDRMKQNDVSEFLSQETNRARTQTIIEDLIARSPQLRAIINDPRMGAGLKMLLITSAVAILTKHDRIDDTFKKLSKLDPKAGDSSTSQEFLTAVLANDMRDMARANETSANTLKVFHDTLQSTTRNIRS